MATDYIVFPSTKRVGEGMHDSRMFTEKNITNIIKSITDMHSYVINEGGIGSNAKFVIEGYYFDIPRNGNIAYIKVENGELVWNGNTAVTWDSKPSTDNDDQMIYELNLANNNSKFKLKEESIEPIKTTKISCGTLT